MAPFDPKYSRQQKLSLAVAIVEGRQGIKTAQQAVDLLAAGELEDVDTGERIDPVDMRLETARTLARNEKKRRAGNVEEGELAGQSTDAAVDQMVRKLARIAADEIFHVQRARKGKRDLKRAKEAGQLLQIVRAVDRGAVPTQSQKFRDAKTPAPAEPASTRAAAMVADLNRRKGTSADPRETNDLQDTPAVHERTQAPQAETEPKTEQTDENGEGGILRDAGDARGWREVRERAEQAGRAEAERQSLA